MRSEFAVATGHWFDLALLCTRRYLATRRSSKHLQRSASLGVALAGMIRQRNHAIRIIIRKTTLEGARHMATVHSLKPSPETRRKVLVVEDNLDSVHTMAMLIKSMGHEVQFASNGFAAIALARDFKPDVVLLDIGLPDFKGDRIAEQSRYEPGLENVRIIAITGLPLADVERRALNAGCEQVFVKPMDPATVEKLLAEP